MNPVSEDIKDILVAASQGTFAGISETAWAIYINEEPKSPDKTITIYDVAPKASGYANRNIPVFEEAPFQLRVRSKGFLTSYTKLKSVINTLRIKEPFNVEGTESGELQMSYSGIFLVSDAMPLEKDEHYRYIWVSTMKATRQRKYA